MKETWIKWPISVGHNFKAYHLRGKHGQSGRFQWDTILRRTICEGNMDKVADLSGTQF